MQKRIPPPAPFFSQEINFSFFSRKSDKFRFARFFASLQAAASESAKAEKIQAPAEHIKLDNGEDL